MFYLAGRFIFGLLWYRGHNTLNMCCAVTNPHAFTERWRKKFEFIWEQTQFWTGFQPLEKKIVIEDFHKRQNDRIDLEINTIGRFTEKNSIID